jgi:hypothetical protein
MSNPDYIDPQGYCVGADGAIRRMTNADGDLPIIIHKTESCSDAEWKRVCDALTSHNSAAPRVLPQFHVEHNRVVIS